MANPLIEKDDEQPPTRADIVRELATDFQYALTRKGRAPLVMSGVPMFDDLCALQDTIACCLELEEHDVLRHWHTVLNNTLPLYEPSIVEIRQALDRMEGISHILDTPLPTKEKPGLGGDAVALKLAHFLGTLADNVEINPWLRQFRTGLLAVSERYWSGLFHAYDIVGLPRTNNDHESLYGQMKRQLRRRLGISQLRESLMRHGAWAVFPIKATSASELEDCLAQVSQEDYFAERARYEQRQEQFRRRYRWRHLRDDVLQQRVTDWAEVVRNC